MNARREEMSGTLVLGRYRIVELLAQGGMGVVYLARTEGAQGFTRPVIVKRIIPELASDEAAARSFVREARILANLQHPGIVNVIDFDEEDDGAYVMVLEYVHGYNLGQWHKYVVDTRKQMPVDHAIYIMTRVLDALHYAHTFVRNDGTPMQIIHRDVSPGNILIDMQAHVKLLDFGIARADETDEYKTRDGMFKGKLTYAAPEVFDGSSSSPKSDVYSAGVVLYQLLTGANPFRGQNMPEIVRRVLTEKLPPVRTTREDVTPELEAVLDVALAKDPAERYPTASAFADALRAVRPRREEEFATDLVDEVWNDFNGPMPAKLGLEPLQQRDAAWRAAQGDVPGERVALRSTPPPPSHDAEALTQALHAVENDRPTRMEATRPRSTAAATWLAGGAVVLAAGAALFSWSNGKKPEPSPSRFVVVEKQSRDETRNTAPEDPSTQAATEQAPLATAPPSPSASVGAVAAAHIPVTGPTRTAAGTGPAVGGAGKPDPAALSRAVQRQRGQIESCFLQHVKDVDGRPEVSVRFRVAQSGKVESADLNPSALDGTPLGQCLLGVARGTSFGAQSEPISFTIPITARRVR